MPTPKKTASKKPATKKTPAKKVAKKSVPATKTPAVKKAPAKKSVAKKTPVKKVVKSVSAPKNTPVKKITTKKPVVKKTTRSIAKTTLKKEAKVVAKQAKRFSKTVKKEVKEEFVKVESSKLYKELALMISRPDRFFSKIKKSKDFNNSIFFIALMGMLYAIINIIFNITSIGLISATMSLATSPIIALVDAFALAGIVMLISHACDGELSFEKTIKAISYTTILFPIFAILGNLGFSQKILIYTFNLALAFVYTYFIYNIVVYTLKANIKKAIVALLVALFLIIIYMPTFVEVSLGFAK